MPWPKAHKAETRERILDAAASAFREAGVSEIGVGELMRRAGLTHGGFYAHFASKDDLLAAMVPHAMADSQTHLDRLRGKAPEGLLETAHAYLSAEHTGHSEMGCAIAALGPELSRGAPSVRQSIAKAIRKRLGELEGLVSRRRSREKRRAQAAGALACMVGGVILARGVKRSERDSFLADCRAFLDDALSESEAPAL